MSLQFLSDKQTLPSQAHASPVTSVCWASASSSSSSSSQGLILSGDCDGNIKCFDASLALAYQALPKAHHNAVHCISVNHLESLALSSSIDGSIALWDVKPYLTATPSVMDADADSEPSPLPLPVEDPSSLHVASINTLTQHSGSDKLSEAWKTLIHPDEAYFASTGAGAIISLHRLPSSGSSALGDVLGVSQLPPSLKDKKDLFGLSLAFHPNAPLLAVGTNTGQVLLYSTPNLELLSMYTDHPAAIRALSFTATLLVVGSDDRTISVHDVKPILQPSQLRPTPSHQARQGGTVASLTAHKGWVLDLATPPGSDAVFASVGADKSIKFWDLASVTKTTPVWNANELSPIMAFAFQPGSTQTEAEAHRAPNSMVRFVTASEDGKLRWYRGAGLG